MHEAIKSRSAVMLRAGRGMPPVIDEHVERVERFDVVPPQRRNEEGVARTEVGRLGRRQSVPEPREARLGPSEWALGGSRRWA